MSQIDDILAGVTDLGPEHVPLEVADWMRERAARDRRPRDVERPRRGMQEFTLDAATGLIRLEGDTP